MAAGIREGWSRDKPLDLNTATKEELLSLPGVTAAEADQVIAGRPYNEPGEVVTRRIMSKSEYDKIAGPGHDQEMAGNGRSSEQRVPRLRVGIPPESRVTPGKVVPLRRHPR